MRKNMLIFAMLAMMSLACNCPKSSTDDLFRGKHSLCVPSNTPNSEDTKYFHLCSETGVGEENCVKYMWQQNKDSSFAVSVLRLDKVRVKFDSDAVVPYVKYRWRSTSPKPDLQENIDDYVVYMVVVCRVDDCPAMVRNSVNK